MEKLAWQKETQTYGINNCQDTFYTPKMSESKQSHSTQKTKAPNVHSTAKTDTVWTLGLKAKHEIRKHQWGRELKDVTLEQLIIFLKIIFVSTKYAFHSGDQIIIKMQQNNETIDENWKTGIAIIQNRR